MIAMGAIDPSVAAFRAAVHARLAAVQRLVVKVGTNVIMRDSGSVAIGQLYALIESVGSLRRAGRDVLVVSSGAVGLGAERLGLAAAPSALAVKQACAAVGQSRLMALYEDGFARLGLVTAQVLLTNDDFADPDRYRNLRATLDTLFRLGIVPIVNENDTVSTVELECDAPAEIPTRASIFSDNDMLSALLASKIGADALLLLSDVDGLFTTNPARDTGATLIPVVRTITTDIIAAADGGGARGRGGMASKLAAARRAVEAGVLTIVANGRRPNVIDHLCSGTGVGTVFLPSDLSREFPQ